MTNQPGPSKTPLYSTFRLLAFAPVLFCALTVITRHSYGTAFATGRYGCGKVFKLSPFGALV
jgi:hypothetical protein